MELIVLSPQEDQFIKEISFNFEDIKQEMTARLAKYENLVYDEKAIKEAKADRATLNKFREAIETKRKEVKKQCLAPYEEFERKIKELTGLVDQPMLAIDGQIKAYEQRQKDEKKASIKAYYQEHIGTLAELLTFEKIFDDKWLNASTKLKDIYTIIDAAIDKISADIQTITDLKSEFELQIKDMYLRTLDIGSALNEKTRLEQQKAKLGKYQQQSELKASEEEAARRIASGEAKTIVIDGSGGDWSNAQPGDTISFAEAGEQAPIYQFTPAPEMAQPIKQIDFRVYATDQQLALLKAFLVDNGIRYGRAI